MTKANSWGSGTVSSGVYVEEREDNSRMKHIFLVLSITAVLFFSGCSSTDVRKQNEGTAADTSSQNEEIDNGGDNIIDNNKDELRFGFDSEGEDMDVYIYDGDKVRIPFSLDVAKATGHDVGFLVFIDGIVQKYAIEYADGRLSDENIMQLFKLDKEEEQKFTIQVTPNVGKKGEKYGVYVCGIIYPSFQPQSIEEPSYGYFGSLNQVVPQQIKFEKDAPESSHTFLTMENGLELPDHVKDSILMFSTLSIEETLEDTLFFEMYQDSENETSMISKEGKITLHLWLCGGINGIYNTTIFINNEPVTVNGKDCIQSELKANKMSECEVTLDISDYDGLNTIYAITVPADAGYLEYRSIEKSKSRLLVNDLKQ